MSTPLEIIEAEAMKLSLQERAELANRLSASLGGDSTFDEALVADVDGRITEIEACRVQKTPVGEAIA